jgi:hypothetical protein
MMKLFEEVLSRTPSDILFHYTSPRGLIGIITSKILWASRIQYLNDSQEYLYSLNLLEKVINDYKTIDERHKERLNTFYTMFQYAENVNIFVASLSENGDLLSQWRAYCPPSGGYSIGFSYDYLQRVLKINNFHLAPCIYDPKLQEQIIIEFISSLLEEESSDLFDVSRDPFRRFNAIASILKHPSFEEEKEWRLFSSPIPLLEKSNAIVSGLHFRDGKSTIIPYYDIVLENENIKFDIK